LFISVWQCTAGSWQGLGSSRLTPGYATGNTYHIAGKFGGDKVYRFHLFQAFGEKKFGE